MFSILGTLTVFFSYLYLSQKISTFLREEKKKRKSKTMAQTMEWWHTTEHYHKSKSYSLESFVLCVVREQIGFAVRSQRRMGIAAPRTGAQTVRFIIGI